MLPAVTDNQDEGAPIRVSLFQHSAKSSGLLGTAQKTSGFDMGGQPLGH